LRPGHLSKASGANDRENKREGMILWTFMGKFLKNEIDASITDPERRLYKKGKDRMFVLLSLNCQTPNLIS
jgi:hypothetical protein